VKGELPDGFTSRIHAEKKRKKKKKKRRKRKINERQFWRQKIVDLNISPFR
jgi:hypothetical protein